MVHTELHTELLRCVMLRSGTSHAHYNVAERGL